MTSLTLSTASPATTKADAVVVAALQGADGPVADDAAFAAAIEAAALAGATGKPGSVTIIPAAGLGVSADRVVVVGIGKAPEGASTVASDAAWYERVRQAAGAASRALAGHGKVVSTLAAIDLTAAAEGHLLGAYVFDTYKKPGKPPVDEIVLSVESAAKATKETLARAVITAEAVALARDLINSAPNDLFPAEFAARASAAGKDAGVTVEVLDEKALAKAGYGGILGVGVQHVHRLAGAGGLALGINPAVMPQHISGPVRRAGRHVLGQCQRARDGDRQVQPGRGDHRRDNSCRT